MKIKHYLNRTLIMLFCLIPLAWSCTADGEIKEDGNFSPKAIPVIQVFSRDTVIHQEYIADIEAVRNVELRARVEGFLEKIYVDEGQEVNKGQILFRLNDEEYQAELAKAKANHRSAIAQAKAAELEVERLVTLVNKNVIANSELELAKARLSAARAKIEEARWAESNAAQRLSYTSIRAPFNGIIDRIPFKAGSLIDHGTLLTTVSDVSAVNVYFNVSEGEYLEYVRSKVESSTKEKPKVNLVLADGTAYPHIGSIETMEGEFHANTGAIAFRAKFPNPDMYLKHGATGKIKMARKIEGAVLVPQKAVFEIQDKYYVYKINGVDQAVMKNFVPRTRFSDYYIVESGLEPGDLVVFEGIQQIRHGMPVIPKLQNDSTFMFTNQPSSMNQRP